MRRNGNRDADRRTSVMPAATNLGSYSDRSSFFNKPASVCGCLAPPPPTLPPKIPHDAGPPSSPQEMSNMLSTGILCQRWRAVRWCACAASERMGRDRCDALRGAEAARLLRGAWMLPQILPCSVCERPAPARRPRESSTRGGGPGPLPGAVGAAAFPAQNPSPVQCVDWITVQLALRALRGIFAL
jgi:hypothetical protein